MHERNRTDETLDALLASGEKPADCEALARMSLPALLYQVLTAKFMAGGEFWTPASD